MPNATEKLLARDSLPPASPRLNKGRVMVVATLLGLALVGMTAWTMHRRDAARSTPKPPEAPPLHEVSGPSLPALSLKLQSTYAGMNRELPPPPPPPAPLVPAPVLPPSVSEPVRPLTMTTSPPPPPPAFLTPSLPAPALTTPPPRAVTPAPPQPVPPRPVERIQTPPQAKPAPKSWMGGTVPVAKPPFKGEAGSEGGGKEGGGKGGMIKPVTWEKPEDPTRVLYRSQTIHGVTLHDINSDIPGQVRVQVSRPVVDKMGQQRVLVPQHTIVLGKQGGTPTFGQQRLEVLLDELEFPDGTVVALNQAQLTDKGGAVGGSGQINNHYVKLGVAAVLSALLNIGSRAVVGNNEQFQSTFQQDAAKDVGQSISRDGNSIVQKQLKVPPTITIPAGTAVAIQLHDNISFMKPPTKGK